MALSDSVTIWISRLKAGDQQAALRLWERYFDRLVQLAQARLGSAPRRVEDEEDLALSVFDTLFRGATGGRLQGITNRDDLWWLLLAITKRRAINRKVREARLKRGGGQVVAESDLAGRDGSERQFSLDDLASEEPTPEFLVLMDEQQQRLLDMLRDDRLRHIAVWKMEGYKNSELAEKLGISTRSVERKLNLIRTEWSRELDR